MIFVTVGNCLQSFRRLIEGVDQLAVSGVFGDEEVLVQSGNTKDATVKRCHLEAFVDMDRFPMLIEESSIVICHAGNGTLMQVMQAGKTPVVMPRRKKYLEHIDDHQLDLVRQFSEERRVVVAHEPGDLESAISEVRRSQKQQVLAVPSRMLSLVAEAIRELGGKENVG